MRSISVILNSLVNSFKIDGYHFISCTINGSCPNIIITEKNATIDRIIDVTTVYPFR